MLQISAMHRFRKLTNKRCSSNYHARCMLQLWVE